MHDLLAQRKGFTPEMALRGGKLAGNGAALWLRMQQDDDLWHAERKLAGKPRRSLRAAADSASLGAHDYDGTRMHQIATLGPTQATGCRRQ